MEGLAWRGRVMVVVCVGKLKAAVLALRLK